MSNPSEPAPIPALALAHHLAALLSSHGVEATLRGTDVLVEGNASTWARLFTSLDSTPHVLRLHLEAATRCGTVLSDALNGLGDDLESRANDALSQFCVADFHVFLASVWGLLEEDQVDHHVVVTDNGPWDLYLGAWVSRMSDPAATIPAPAAAFTERLLAEASRLLSERKPTAGRVFVAAHGAEMTYEALLNGEPSPALESLLGSLPIRHSVTGYASQRLFFIAIPRDGAAAHPRTSRCTKLQTEGAPSAFRRALLVAAALVAVFLTAAACFLLCWG